LKQTTALALGIAMLAMLAGPSPPAAALDAACPDIDILPSQTTLPRFEAATLCLINEERVERGYRALGEDPILDGTAQAHSEDMRRHSFFSHDSSDGTTYLGRILASDYISEGELGTVGENIAWGSWGLGTPRYIVTNWLASVHHRANIFDQTYRDIGLGAVWGSPRDPSEPASIIITHDFGRIYRRDKVHRSRHKRVESARKKRRR
jgi:uncharacterized protein YkwD